MKNTALCTLLVIGLAACGDPSAPTTSAPASAAGERPAAAAPAAPAAPAVAKKALESPLPAGVELTFQYHLRTDRIVERKSGKMQRLVVVESLAADMGDAMREVKAAMKAADFHALPVDEDAPRAEDGSRTLTYRKKDWKGLVVIVVTPVGTRDLHQPNAIATVAFTFDQPEEAATAAAAATPAAGG